MRGRAGTLHVCDKLSDERVPGGAPEAHPAAAPTRHEVSRPRRAAPARLQEGQLHDCVPVLVLQPRSDTARHQTRFSARIFTESFQVEGRENRQTSLFIDNTVGRFFTGTFQGGKPARNSCYHVTVSIRFKQNFCYTHWYDIRYKCRIKRRRFSFQIGRSEDFHYYIKNREISRQIGTMTLEALYFFFLT